MTNEPERHASQVPIGIGVETRARRVGRTTSRNCGIRTASRVEAVDFCEAAEEALESAEVLGSRSGSEWV